MKWWSLPLLILCACQETDVQRRYEAERTLWQTDQLRGRLENTGARRANQAWTHVLQEYTDLVRRVREVPRPTTDELVVAARADLTAARLQLALADSTGAESRLAELSQWGGELPGVGPSIWIARGRLAEARGDYAVAVQYYRSAYPALDLSGRDLAQLELPFHVAQVAGRGSVVGVDLQRLEEARQFYGALLDHPRGWIQLHATRLAAEVEASDGELERAHELFGALETRLAPLEEPPIDPARVRLSALRAQLANPAMGSLDSTATLDALASMLEDHANTDAAALALVDMAGWADGLGDRDQALRYLRRLLRDAVGTGLVSEPILANAQQYKAELEAAAGRWADAYRTYQTLPVNFPLSEPALVAPLKIVDHWISVGNEGNARDELGRAEAAYREMLERYPSGEHTPRVRQQLVETLTRQGRYEEALTESMQWLDEVAGRAGELPALVTAARLAYADLGDRVRGRELLERIAFLYPNTETGGWAARAAAALGTVN